MDSPRLRLACRALVAVALLACAAPAQAGTLSLSGGSLVYQAAPGEANAVTVEAQGSGPFARYTVRDDGAPVVSRLPCLAGGCTGEVREVIISLGDGNDSAIMPPAYSALSAYVDGGPGDDRLAGGRTSVAGSNPERLEGGTGRDTLTPRDGGRATGGPDGDTLGCVGGALGCYLEGGDGPDLILGGPGTDALTGGPGTDLLDGRGGPDGLTGGPGDDVINAVDGVSENVFCDDGDRDAVSGDPADSTFSCEIASFALTPTVRRVRKVVARGKAVRRGKRLNLTATTRIAQASRGTKVPCTGGRVRFRVLIGNRVAGLKSVKLPRRCGTARTRLRMKLKRREQRVRKVRVSAEFLGNGWLQARAGKLAVVKVRATRR